VADEQEPVTGKPLGMDQRAAVENASERYRAPPAGNVYIKAGAAVAQALASGAIGVTEAKAAATILEDARTGGVSAEEAFKRVEENAPSVAEALRGQLARPVTWAFLSFVVNLIRLLLEGFGH
jgi:hypothetical protein